MRAAVFMAVAMAALPVRPVLAQDADPACLASFNALAGVLGITRSVTVTQDGWCTVDGVTVGGDAPYSSVISVDRARWQTDGTLAMADGVRLPTGLRAEIFGLRIGVTTGDPVIDYIFAVQQKPNAINATLDLAWDPVGQVLTLRNLDLDFPGDNRVQMTGEVTRIDATTLSAMLATAPMAGLTRLDVTARTNGLFETYVAFPAGTLFLTGSTDPAADMARLRDNMTTYVAGLPAAILPTPSRDALVALVADLPNPAGTVSLTLTSEQGFGGRSLAPVLAGGLNAALADPSLVLGGVNLTFDYIRTP